MQLSAALGSFVQLCALLGGSGACRRRFLGGVRGGGIPPGRSAGGAEPPPREGQDLKVRFEGPLGRHSGPCADEP
eukprot:9801154-Alexandrium_andersonii.AAC.1